MSRSVAGSKSAIAPTVSSGCPPERCQRSRSRTTTSASAKSRSTSPKSNSPLVGEVAPQRLVHHGRARLQCGLRIGHRWQRLVLDVDELERVLREVAAVGDDDGHALTDVAHLLRGQAAPRVLGRVGTEVGQGAGELRGPRPGDHQVHAGSGLRGAGVDRDDPRVRHRAAQHRGVQHPRPHQVGDVAAAAAQELGILDLADRFPDPRPVRLVGAHGRRGGAFDGGHAWAPVVSVGVSAGVRLPSRMRGAAASTASTMYW